MITRGHYCRIAPAHYLGFFSPFFIEIFAFSLAVVEAYNGQMVAHGAPPAAEVRKAVNLAKDYLLSTQSPNGTWSSWGSHELGETALACMALAASGVPADDPKISLAIHAIREKASADSSTYDLSLAIMCLDGLGDQGDTGLLKQLGLRLSAGQCSNGAWSYSVPVNGQTACNAGDNSNTQFAALAAWVSRDHGVENDGSLAKLDQYFRGSFDSGNGGWGYGPGSRATETMTCAGLVGLATYFGTTSEASDRPADKRRGARKRAAANDPLAQQALRALGRELQMADRTPGDPLNQDLYFFWSLERVGVVYGVKDIGGVDWYTWGARRLIDGQMADGQWIGKSKTKGWVYGGNVGTSFGILFLTKANAAADLTARVGSGAGIREEVTGNGGGTQFLRRGGQPAQSSRPKAGSTPKADRGPSVLDPRAGDGGATPTSGLPDPRTPPKATGGLPRP